MNLIRINEIEIPEVQLYADRAETKLKHFFEPEPGLFIAESLLVIQRAIAAGYEPLHFLVEEKYLPNIESITAQYPGIPVYTAKRELIGQIAGYKLTRGVLAAMRRKSETDHHSVIENANRLVILEDVENPANLGAIVRSAAALGMDGILFTKACTDPLYRRSIRVSMGCIFQIPWAFCPDGREIANELKKDGFITLATALKEDTIPLDELKISCDEKIAVFMGSEGPGLLDETISACDHSVMIPMTHGVDSLNVAAASAVMFWAINHAK